MTDTVPGRPPQIDPYAEEGLALSAEVGAIWGGSRLMVGACTFLYGAFGFAFFYLRSLNSHGMWHPSAQQPSLLVGTAATVVLLGAAALHHFGLRRLRDGLNLDWRVAAVTALGLIALAIGLQVFLLTRLDFFPGSSGYASVFVGWVPVHVSLLLGALYWLETLVARSLRVREAWKGEGGLGGSVSAEAIRLRASLDAFDYFLMYLAAVGIAFWFMFYVVG